jgi:ubiquinone/menaquinone biosynthesis C-methylase UbiE
LGTPAQYFLFLGPRQLQPTISNSGSFLVLVLVVCALANIFARLTESNTDNLRKFIRKRMPSDFFRVKGKMDSSLNKAIYNERYVPAQLEFTPTTPYDVRILELRRGLLGEHCAGKDVLDLCCGSGTYLVDLLGRARSIVGLDFSQKLIKAAAARTSGTVGFVEGDARSLPFAEGSFDTVFSFASLYYVPNVQQAIAETARVLRPGGVAILDLGNSRSLATLTGRMSHRLYGWAKSYAIPYDDLLDAISKAGLVIEHHYVSQILPLFGPRLVQMLLPFSASLFKYPLGLVVHGRMLDFIISGAPLLRRIAFRHLFVLRKAQHE